MLLINTMGNLVSSEAVYNKKDTEDLFPKKSDIYTKKESDVKFQPIGDYQPKGDYAVVGGVYAKTDVYNKTESDTRFQTKGNYALTSALDGYQPKGDYALTTALADYALKTALADYQPKGDYALKTALADYQPKGDYALKTDYQPKGDYALKTALADYQPKGDYALTTALADYQPKGDYALTTALADYALTTALADYALKTDYQPKGDYALTTALADYQPKVVGGVYAKTDVYNKTESDARFQPTVVGGVYAKTDIYNKTESDARFQPTVVGGVYNKTESDARFQPTVVGGVYNKTESDGRFQQTVVGGVYAKPDVYNKTESDTRFQPKGDYQLTVVGGVYAKPDVYNKTESDTRFQPKGDYALTNALAAYAKKTDILKGDTGPQGAQGPKGGVQIDDTRSADSPPSFYRAKGVNKYHELKLKSVIKTPSTQEYNMVETIVSWGDVSGGPVVQIAYGENQYYRQSSSESAWGPWKVVLQSEANGNTTIPGFVNARGVTTTDITATGNVQIANGYISNDLWFNGPTNRWILHTPDDGRTEMYITPGNDAKNDWNWNNSTIFYKDGSITTKKLGATDLNATNVNATNVNATGNMSAKNMYANNMYANNADQASYTQVSVGKGVLFKNGDTRTDDGGVKTFTVRNNDGDLRLQASSGRVRVPQTAVITSLHVGNELGAAWDKKGLNIANNNGSWTHFNDNDKNFIRGVTEFSNQLRTAPGKGLCNSDGSICVDVADLVTKDKEVNLINKNWGRLKSFQDMGVGVRGENADNWSTWKVTW